VVELRDLWLGFLLQVRLKSLLIRLKLVLWHLVENHLIKSSHLIAAAALSLVREVDFLVKVICNSSLAALSDLWAYRVPLCQLVSLVNY